MDDQGEMAERQAQSIRASRPVKHQPNAERADEAAGIAAHAVQAHGGAAQPLVGGLHGPGRQGRAIEINCRVPEHDQRCREDSRRARAPSRHQGQEGGGAHGHGDQPSPSPNAARPCCQ